MTLRISMVLTLVSGFFSSLCCIGPILLVPLGMSGLYNMLNSSLARYSQYFGWFTYLMIIWTGWQVYGRKTNTGTRILYWIGALVSVGLANYLALSNWFLRTFIHTELF